MIECDTIYMKFPEGKVYRGSRLSGCMGVGVGTEVTANRLDLFGLIEMF